MRTRTAFMLLLPLLLSFGAACGTGSGGAEPAADGKLEVVAGFYPLAEAASRVGGDRAVVTNVTPAGTEPHDLELTTRQVDAVERASIVLFLGEGFQPELEKLAARADGVAVDLLEGQELLEAGEEGHGHGDEEEHEEEAGDDEHGSPADPHVWLDPQRMRGIVERILATFVEVDGDAAAEYRANAEEYLEELAALDQDMEQGLANCERDAIVTSHDAFGYLAARYGFTQEAIAGLSPESEPDPRRLAELADEVEAEGISTIFYETLVSPEIAETLAREAKVTTAVLNPLEGLTDEELAAGETYASVMRQNLAALREALGCS